MKLKHSLAGVFLCALGSFSVADNSGEQSSDKRWAQWLLSQVSQLPSQEALVYRQSAADYRREASAQPLYNPELSVSYEDKSEEDVSFVISQTLDWSGKRRAHTVAAEVVYDGESQWIKQTREEAVAKALQALVDFNAAEQLLELSQQQKEALKQLNSIVEQRQRAGDVQKLDAELSYLSMAQILPTLSIYHSKYIMAVAALKQTLNVDRPVFPLSDDALWRSSISPTELQAFLTKSPAVVSAKNRLAQAKAAADIARLQKKANPTIGIGVGKEGQEEYLALAFSMPLNIRNTYSASYQAEQSRVLEAEVQWRDQTRRTKSMLLAKRENYLMQTKLWDQWTELTQGRAEQSQALLKKQWQAGDLGTIKYLFALQQRNKSLAAGIELSAKAQKSWVDWLLSTQQVESWLRSLSSGAIASLPAAAEQ